MGELINTAWAGGVTLAVPQLFTKGVFVHLMLSFLANAAGILSKSLRGVVFTIACVLGELFFVSLWVGWVLYIGDSYPSWEIAMVKSGMNFIYTGVTVILYGFCFYVVPFSAFILWKDKPEQEAEKSEQKPRDWTGMATTAGQILGTAAIIDDLRRDEGTTFNNTIYAYPNTPLGPSHQLPEEVPVEAIYREVPRLGTGQRYLTSGNPDDSNDNDPSQGHGDSPSGTHLPEEGSELDSAIDPKPSKSTWVRHRREKHQDPIMGESEPSAPHLPEEPPVIHIDTSQLRQPPPPKPGKAERLANTSGVVAQAAAVLGKPEIAAAAKSLEVAARTADKVITSRKAKANAKAEDPVL